MVKLQVILADVTKKFFGENERQSRQTVWRKVKESFRLLADWLEQLPECIAAGQKWTPATLDLQ